MQQQNQKLFTTERGHKITLAELDFPTEASTTEKDTGGIDKTAYLFFALNSDANPSGYIITKRKNIRRK